MRTQSVHVLNCMQYFIKGGMSMRHEGLIYNTTTKMWLKDLVYLDMLARTAKCILWKNLRYHCCMVLILDV